MWKYVAVPIVGALIGYVTNWIAVKMLFRPRYEKKLFGMTLPFTPGVIPKGKKRLAKAVGRAVEEQLLTREVLEGVLLSTTTKFKLLKAVEDFLKSYEECSDTIEEKLIAGFSEEEYTNTVDQIENKLTDYIYDEVVDMDPGELLAAKIVEIASEKLKDSFLGMMLGGSLMETIRDYIKNGINEYLVDEGRVMIHGIVKDQGDKFTKMPVGNLIMLAEENEVDIPKIVLKIYEYLITEKLADMFTAINISGIVENRIDAMEIEELEELVLSIMKKELGAIVNLGALIGFILGLVNLAILYL